MLEKWYNNLKRGSPSTADLYYRVLTKFCKDTGVSPEKLLNLSDGELRDLILDYVHRLDFAGKSGSHQENVISAIKSWLRFNGRELTIKVKVSRKSRIAEREVVPKPEDVGKLLKVAGLKERVVISLMAFSGVRENVIGNYEGTDGLRLVDLPDLRVEGRIVDFVKEPAMVVVRAELNKARHQYFTFLCREGMEFVLDWLRYRIRRGEELKLHSPLIPSRRGLFMRSMSVSNLVKKVIEVAGYSWRPYVLRHYFDTQMLLAEAGGIIPRDYRVFWMGHKGDIEHVYTTNKHRLPDHVVKDMRYRYERAAEEFLLPHVSVREPSQKVVSLEELERYLESGWEFVTTLPNGKVIVRRSF